MISFLHSFHPGPIFIQLGTLPITWYGLFLAIGLLAAFWVTQAIAQQRRFKNDVLILFVNTFVIGFIGARIYHILNELSYYLDHPAEIIAIWHGGLAIHGGLIAGFLYLVWYARKNKISIWSLTDLLVPGLALGQAIGRWGNYFNQELYGAPTTVPWGIPIDIDQRVVGFERYLYFHPTFLYESIWYLIVFSVLWLLWRDQKKQRTPSSLGLITMVYFVLVGLGRGLFEMIRIDDTLLIWGARLPLLVSIVLFGIGCAGIVWLRRHAKLPWS